MRSQIGLAGTVALSVLAVLALAAGSVLGHAELQSSDPADGATIQTPYTTTATYDDELTPDGSSIVVQNSSGAQVAAGTVSATDDKQMTVELPQLPDGEYEVLWTAVTADDTGVTRDTFTFTVASAAPSGSTTVITPAPSPTPTSVPIDGDLNGSIAVVVVAALVVVLAIAGFFIYRNRR